ncbi:MAG: J domain-containing protein [Lysobacter sp.]
MEAVYRTRARFAKQRTVQSSFTNPDGSRGSYNRMSEISIADAVSRIRSELARMGIDDDDLVISTNLLLRLDGLPRSSQRDPDDPGAAVYWTDAATPGNPPRCMAIDRYDRVADNLAAVAATLEAMRAIERHGGAAILERAFTGFTALPAPEAKDPWWEVLGWRTRAMLTAAAVDHGLQQSCNPLESERQLVVDAYRRLRSQHHPDKPGGDATAFRRVQAAYDQYQLEQGK